MLDTDNNCIFLGQYEVSMDAKNRLSIPTKWRMKMGQEIIMFKNPDNVLSVTRRDIFNKVCSKLMSSNPFDKNVRTLKRLLLGSAQEIELDKWSRFVISAQMFNSSDLGRDLILVGAGEYVEIWNKNKYETWESGTQDLYDQTAQALVQKE